jgi:large subunit ribosomal protein L27
MAHKKAGGSKAKQGGNVAGKRLGIKIYGGQLIKEGQIILRQRGALYKAGDGVGVGTDFTLFALRPGTVKFAFTTKTKKIVSVE